MRRGRKGGKRYGQHKVQKYHKRYRKQKSYVMSRGGTRM